MRLRSPRLNGDRAGTGDLFAALLVARLATGSGLLSAAMHAVGATTAIIESSMLTGTDELPVAEGFIDLPSPPVRFEPRLDGKGDPLLLMDLDRKDARPGAGPRLR